MLGNLDEQNRTTGDTFFTACGCRSKQKQGLEFCRTDGIFGKQNNGHSLRLIVLRAEFDQFLANHITKYDNQGQGRPSVLSVTNGDF